MRCMATRCENVGLTKGCCLACVDTPRCSNRCPFPIHLIQGALALVSFAPATNLFDSCVFRSNVGDDGGAVFVGESGGTFVNCVFEDNESGSGGAVHLTAAGTTYISNSTFVGNTASFGGATYVSRRSKGFFTDSVFADNVATSKGGAVSGDASAVGTYTRCDFAHHSAVFAGGVVHVKGRSKMYFYTADMSDNTAPKVCLCSVWVGYDCGHAVGDPLSSLDHMHAHSSSHALTHSLTHSLTLAHAPDTPNHRYPGRCGERRGGRVGLAG